MGKVTAAQVRASEAKAEEHGAVYLRGSYRISPDNVDLWNTLKAEHGPTGAINYLLKRCGDFSKER